MKYFGIKDKNDELICVATEETIEAVRGEIESILKDVCEVLEISKDDLDKFIEEFSSAGMKFLCRTLERK